MVGSYLDSPLYQRMLAQTMQGGPASQYPGQAISNALAQALQAYTLKGLGEKQEAKQQAGNADLAKALLPEQFRDVGGGASYNAPLSGGGEISGTLPNIQDPNSDKRSQLAALLNNGVVDAKSLAPQALQNIGMGPEQTPEFDTTPRVGVNPQTGKRGQFVQSKTGETRWLDANPDTKIELNNGVAYDPYALQPGQIVDRNDPNKPFNPVTGEANEAYQGYQAQVADQQRQMTPYQRESLALQRQSANNSQGGAIPSGYMRGPDGVSLTHIPGGPADPAVAGRGTGKPTEDQAKNAQLYTLSKKMLPQVLENFDSLSGLGNAVGNTIGNLPFVGPGPAVTTSAGYQQAESGLNSLVANFLYSTSGATATPDEVKNRASTVRPRVGDSPQTIALKKKALTDMVESIKLRASPQLLQQAPQGGQSGGVDELVNKYLGGR